MRSMEQAPQEKLEASKWYFYERAQANERLVRDDAEERRDKLSEHLRDLGNGHWSGGEKGYEADIISSSNDEVIVVSGDRAATTRHYLSDSPVWREPIEQKGDTPTGRPLEWAVTVYTPRAVHTIFRDTETGKLGVYEPGETEASYVFRDHDYEEALIGHVEDFMAEIFYPGSDTKFQPSDFEYRYTFVPRDQ